MASTETIQRHPLAIAWDEWLASDEGQQCRDASTLTTNSMYLEHRLWRAFIAGANSSPSDAERLSELRRAARKAATWIEQSLFDRPHDEQGDTVVAKLLMALNPQPEKETQGSE